MNKQEEDELQERLRAISYREICYTRAREMQEQCVIEVPMEQYRLASDDRKFFGGMPEMLVLADVICSPIEVFEKKDKGLKCIARFGQNYYAPSRKFTPDNVVRLLYSNNIHYDALFIV